MAVAAVSNTHSSITASVITDTELERLCTSLLSGWESISDERVARLIELLSTPEANDLSVDTLTDLLYSLTVKKNFDAVKALLKHPKAKDIAPVQLEKAFAHDSLDAECIDLYFTLPQSKDFCIVSLFRVIDMTIGNAVVDVHKADQSAKGYYFGTYEMPNLADVVEAIQRIWTHPNIMNFSKEDLQILLLNLCESSLDCNVDIARIILSHPKAKEIPAVGPTIRYVRGRPMEIKGCPRGGIALLIIEAGNSKQFGLMYELASHPHYAEIPVETLGYISERLAYNGITEALELVLVHPNASSLPTEGYRGLGSIFVNACKSENVDCARRVLSCPEATRIPGRPSDSTMDWQFCTLSSALLVASNNPGLTELVLNHSNARDIPLDTINEIKNITSNEDCMRLLNDFIASLSEDQE